MIPIAEPSITQKEIDYVHDAISSGWVSSQGKYMDLFITALQQQTGAKHALPVNNGTASLILPLLALGLTKGDEVIVPDYTFAATVNAVIIAGGTPVIIDVGNRAQMTASDFSDAISERTKAVIPVHLYGEVGEIEEICTIAAEHNIFVLEDAAEVYGAFKNGKSAGTFGDCGSFSFYGNKIVTTGEGGAITTNNTEFYEKMKMIMNHGMRPHKRYWHEVVGCNFRMTNLQAAVGVAQLERITDIQESRMNLFKAYASGVENISGCTTFSTVKRTESYIPAQWLFNVVLDKSNVDDVVERMHANGVDARRTFYPMHSMDIYSEYTNQKLSYENSVHFANAMMSIPSSTELSNDQIKTVLKVLEESIG